MRNLRIEILQLTETRQGNKFALLAIAGHRIKIIPMKNKFTKAVIKLLIKHICRPHGLPQTISGRFIRDRIVTLDIEQLRQDYDNMRAYNKHINLSFLVAKTCPMVTRIKYRFREFAHLNPGNWDVKLHLFIPVLAQKDKYTNKRN